MRKDWNCIIIFFNFLITEIMSITDNLPWNAWMVNHYFIIKIAVMFDKNLLENGISVLNLSVLIKGIECLYKWIFFGLIIFFHHSFLTFSFFLFEIISSTSLISISSGFSIASTKSLKLFKICFIFLNTLLILQFRCVLFVFQYKYFLKIDVQL